MVIVGDSLATGVGCTTNTPALARIVAERLAELLSVEIEWIAVGKKGAALSDISSCVLPELRESNNSRRSVSNSNHSGSSRESRSSNSSSHDSVKNEVEEKEGSKKTTDKWTELGLHQLLGRLRLCKLVVGLLPLGLRLLEPLVGPRQAVGAAAHEGVGEPPVRLRVQGACCLPRRGAC